MLVMGAGEAQELIKFLSVAIAVDLEEVVAETWVVVEAEVEGWG
jgi:hypothetical protein